MIFFMEITSYVCRIVLEYINVFVLYPSFTTVDKLMENGVRFYN